MIESKYITLFKEVFNEKDIKELEFKIKKNEIEKTMLRDKMKDLEHYGRILKSELEIRKTLLKN